MTEGERGWTVGDDGRWDGRSASELAEGWGVPLVEVYRTIGSTNDRAAELAGRAGPRPSVVVAEEQTSGRGRRGDAWQSSAGAGIWMSLVLDAERAFPQLPLVVGVACARAIDRALDVAEPMVMVKWPNDLVVADRKIGGILCEASPRAVVVGVGINVGVPEAGFHPDFARSATALEVVGAKAIVRNELAGGIVTEILSVTGGPAPFETVRAELERRDALLGRAVATEEHGEGVARGIDTDGSLRLELPEGGMRSVVSGSVRLAAITRRG